MDNAVHQLLQMMKIKIVTFHVSNLLVILPFRVTLAKILLNQSLEVLISLVLAWFQELTLQCLLALNFLEIRLWTYLGPT